MQDILAKEFLNNTISDYLFAIGTLIGGLIAIAILRKIGLHRLRKWAMQTENTIDDAAIRAVKRYIVPLFALGVVYISITSLTLQPLVRQIIDVISILLMTILIVQFLGALVTYSIRLYAYSKRDEVPNLEMSLNALAPAIKVVLWSVGVIFLLDNFGMDITAIVASLGIGGVAIALASQGFLQDLFSYFSILFDQPFEIGDFIKIGDNVVGTVEYIGIKTTKIRSISGEQLILTNSDLTSARIQNFKRMERRRVVFQLGVTYETGLGALEQIPGIIRTIIESTENTLFDRAHFFSFGDFSLNFEVVYFVTTSDYNAYMDAQQHINLELKRSFAEQQIEFAYPTQVNYLTSAADSDSPSSNGQAKTIVQALKLDSDKRKP